MRCENNFCIYCDNNECILDDIFINNLGMCDDCIFIDLDEKTLKNQKQILLNKFKEYAY